MSRLEVVIFGATGFTGKHTVQHMVAFAKKYNITSWGVAGRSDKKLQEILKEAAEKTGENLDGVKSIIADVGDEKSLQDMCAQAKVLVNCCGPYRLYGEPVVKAAVQNKTHYVDVSGEPQFMELMQLRYNDLAREAGVFIISACGWDSIPADMGVVFLQQNFEGTLNSVREYVSLYLPPEAAAQAEGRGAINYGTWESLIYGIANMNELAPLRKQLYTEPLPSLKPKICRQTLHKKDGKGKYYLPFLGSDESVVYRTQRYMYETEKQRPIQFKAYIKIGTLVSSILAILAAMALFIFAKFSFTRQLLLKYPKLFSFGKVSREGPTDVVTQNSMFTFELIGEGWGKGEATEGKPTKTVVAKVSGANPGYGATCAAVLCSAITILRDREQMPAGGVLTTGAAFRKTNLINKLIENNIKYEIVQKQ